MFTIDKAEGAEDGFQLNFNVSHDSTGSNQNYNSHIHILFDAGQSSDPESDPLTYEWYCTGFEAFCNGNSFSTNQRPSVDLAEGLHTITLKVTDNHGNQSTTQGTINITGQSNTQTLPLTWPFISTAQSPSLWHMTTGEGWCGGAQKGDHCGDDWFAQDWNWGAGQDDWGMVLLSPAGGRVIWTGQSSNAPLYGNQVIIQNLDVAPYDYAIRFTHLESVWVTDGQLVCPGTPIGLMGFSGVKSKASHLHTAAYMGLFQNSSRGSDGYHWLDTNATSLETLSLSNPSRFSIRLNFDQSAQPQGCGSAFAVEGRVITSKNKTTKTGLGGVTVTLAGPQGNSTTITFGNSSGHYAFNGLIQGLYTVTPSKTGCTFAPSSANVSIINSHAELPDFTGSGAQCK
jgi:hypothetical protein